jgi:nucleoside-diphosphate-sugar epimerase
MAEKMHFVDIRDLLRGLLLGLEHPNAVGEVFNLPGPRMLSFDEVVPYISRRIDVPYTVANLPIHLNYRELSWEKAHEALGYTPIHDLPSMVDLAIAIRAGVPTELVPTGVPYGEAQRKP